MSEEPEFKDVRIGDVLPNSRVQTEMTVEEWRARGRELFGDDDMKWAFICPVCKHVATARDYREAGAGSGSVGFSCIGRFLPKCRDAFFEEGPGPCNYTGGGLFGLNPVRVTTEKGPIDMFDFATPGEEGPR